MNSIYLDSESWDLKLDSTGSIASCAEPYRLSQDAACNIKTFSGEVFYDTTLGISYLSTVLGKRPNAAYLKAQFNAAAMLVPGTVAAQTFLTALTPTVTGQVQVTDEAGVITAASF